MKRKILAYSFIPMLGLAGILGTGIASAHGFGFFGGLGTLSADEIAARQQTMFQNQAQILGISVDDLKNAWAEGKTMQQIMKEKGVSTEQVQARMKEVHTQQLKSQLETLVQKGVITQAQADKHLQVMQSRIESGMGRMGKFRGGFWF